MRVQWCREHIDEVVENCGLGESTKSDVKQAAKFCASVPEISNCSTDAILALIRIRDEPVKNRAISLARIALIDATPTGGKIQKRMTKPEIKKIIQKAELEIRGELTEQYKEEKKTAPKKPSYNGTPQPGDYPAPDAPVAQTLKEKYGGNDRFVGVNETIPAPVKESLTTPNPCGEACPDCPDPCKPFTCDELKKVGIIADTTRPVSSFSDIPPCKEGKPCPAGRNYLIIQPTLGNKCEQTGGLIKNVTICPVIQRQRAAEANGAIFTTAGQIKPASDERPSDVLPRAKPQGPRELLIRFEEKQWNVLKQIVRENQAETLEDAVLFLVDEAGERMEGS